jgi:hypothetical protein
VTLLDENIFTKAEEIMKGGKQVLRKFLLLNFQPPPKASGVWSVRNVERGGGDGGLEELTPKSVVRNVILPLYAVTEEKEKETGGKG